MECSMKTALQLEREQNIRDVLNDYRDELNQVLKNKNAPSFTLDFSKKHIEAKHKRDFDSWCPVRLSQNYSCLIVFCRSERDIEAGR